MTEYEALYLAICESPDEDTPRLAFADWLDEEGSRENGDRAELIRTHVQLSREEPWSEPWRILNDRWEKIRKKTIKQAKSKKLPWVKHLEDNELSMPGLRSIADAGLGQQLHYIYLGVSGVWAQSGVIGALFPHARIVYI